MPPDTNLFTSVTRGHRRRTGLIPIYKHSTGKLGTWDYKAS